MDAGSGAALVFVACLSMMKRTQARQVRGKIVDAQAGRFSEADRRVSMRRSVTRISPQMFAAPEAQG